MEKLITFFKAYSSKKITAFDGLKYLLEISELQRNSKFQKKVIFKI